MASAVIHLCIAKKVNNYLKIDENMLYLGAIAPDLAKQIGLTKRKSHFLDDEHLEDSIPNVDRFVAKYYYELNKPFEMGYLIHLLTDYYWFKYYINNFVKRYNHSDLDKISLKSLIYDDYTSLNQELIDSYMLNLDIFMNKIDYPTSKISEIPMDKLYIVVEKMGQIIMNAKVKKKILFDKTDIIDFIENISNKIIEDLKNYKLIKEYK